MARDVDHIVKATDDAVVPISVEHRPVPGEVRPVAPVLALRVFAELRVVLPHEAVRILPHGLNNPGPWISDRKIAGAPRPSGYLVAAVIEHDGENAERRRTGAAGLHWIQRGLRRDEKPTRFGLPPRVDNDRLLLPHHIVVPPPCLRFDRLTDRGHVPEM